MLLSTSLYFSKEEEGSDHPTPAVRRPIISIWPPSSGSGRREQKLESPRGSVNGMNLTEQQRESPAVELVQGQARRGLLSSVCL